MSCTADFDCLNEENPFWNLGWNSKIHDPEPELENIFSNTIARKNKSETNGRSTPFQGENLTTYTRADKENNIATGFKDSKSRSASDSSEYQTHPLFLIKKDLKREFETILNFSLPDYSYNEKAFEYLVSSFEDIQEEDFWSPCSPFTLDLEEFFLINLYEGNTEAQTSILDYFLQRKDGNNTIKFLYPLDQILSKVRHTFDLARETYKSYYSNRSQVFLGLKEPFRGYPSKNKFFSELDSSIKSMPNFETWQFFQSVIQDFEEKSIEKTSVQEAREVLLTYKSPISSQSLEDGLSRRESAAEVEATFQNRHAQRKSEMDLAKEITEEIFSDLLGDTVGVLDEIAIRRASRRV